MPKLPRFLVTAGNTREVIDQVRDWGNIFTGATGLGIAQALVNLGEVDLLTSNAGHLQNSGSGIRAIGFATHAELLSKIDLRMKECRYEAIFMTAAVADYRPVRTYAVVQRQPGDESGTERWVVKDAQAGKIKSTHPAIAVLGEPTEKIVDLFRKRWQHKGLLVKFKLEVGISPEELLVIGEQSRLASGADYLVANTLEMVQGQRAGAFLIGPDGHEWVQRADLPRRMQALAATGD